MPDNLDPNVADVLCAQSSVVELMQRPKVAAAIAKLKEDPSCYKELMAGDPELQVLFSQLQSTMESTESELTVPAGKAGGSLEEVAPPLQDEDAFDAEQAKALGAEAFAKRNFSGACVHYERATELQPGHHIHWSNLSVARLGSEVAAQF